MSVAFLAAEAIKLINEQLEKGVDINGNQYYYSTRPFSVPFDKRLSKFAKKSDRVLIFHGAGKLRMLITGGYADYRALFKRANDKDFLQWTGEMMAALTVVDQTLYSATVGFNNPNAAKKAMYFNYYGVGSARKLWKFFGLTAENLEKLKELAQGMIEISENLEIGMK